MISPRRLEFGSPRPAFSSKAKVRSLSPVFDSTPDGLSPSPTGTANDSSAHSRGSSPISDYSTVPVMDTVTRNVDVCEAAMDFVGLLEPEALKAIENNIRQVGVKVHTRTKGSQEKTTSFAVTQAQLVEILREQLQNCPILRNRAQQWSNLPRRVQLTLELEEAAMRKSEKDFRSLLRTTAAGIDDQVLHFIAQSVDRFESNRIEFSHFLDFLVNCGRRAKDIYSSGKKKKKPTEVEQEGGRRRSASESVPPALEDSAKESKVTDLLPVVLPFSNPTKTPYLYAVAIDNVEGKAFALASHRYVDIVDSANEPVLDVPRIVPPMDSAHVIISLGYAPSVEEIIISTSNNKVLMYHLRTGKLSRECKTNGNAHAMAWAPSKRFEDISHVGSHSNALGLLHCGLADGVLEGLVAPLRGVLRVSFSIRLSQLAISHVVSIPHLHIVVATSGSNLFVCCARTGALRQKPHKAHSTISAISPTGGDGLVYSTVDSPNSLYFFSRRTLSSTVGNDPAEMIRERSLLGEPIERLLLDPLNTDAVLSIDSAGYIRRWNIALLSPIYSDGEDVGAEPLRVPNGCIAMASNVRDRCGMIIGRTGLLRLTELPKSAILSLFADPVLSSDCMELSDAVVEVIPCTAHHSSITRGTRPDCCAIFVTKSEVKLKQLVPTSRTIWSVPLHAQLTEKNRLRLTTGGKLHPTSACILRGQSTLLLGLASGALVTLSIEPSSLGECIVIADRFASVELTQVAVDGVTDTLVARLFDGRLVTAHFDWKNGKVSPAAEVVCVGHAASMKLFGRQCHDGATMEVSRNGSSPGQRPPTTLLAVFDESDRKLKLFDFGGPHDGIRLKSSTAPLLSPTPEELPQLGLPAIGDGSSILKKLTSPQQLPSSPTASNSALATLNSPTYLFVSTHASNAAFNSSVIAFLEGQANGLCAVSRIAFDRFGNIDSIQREVFTAGGPVSACCITAGGYWLIAHSHGDFSQLRMETNQGRQLSWETTPANGGQEATTPLPTRSRPLPSSFDASLKLERILTLEETIHRIVPISREAEWPAVDQSSLLGVVVITDSESRFIATAACNGSVSPAPTPSNVSGASGMKQQQATSSSSLSTLPTSVLIARRHHVHSASIRAVQPQPRNGTTLLPQRRITSASIRSTPSRLPPLPDIARGRAQSNWM